jgi:hypothetical protein
MVRTADSSTFVFCAGFWFCSVDFVVISGHFVAADNKSVSYRIHYNYRYYTHRL